MTASNPNDRRLGVTPRIVALWAEVLPRFEEVDPSINRYTQAFGILRSDARTPCNAGHLLFWMLGSAILDHRILLNGYIHSKVADVPTSSVYLYKNSAHVKGLTWEYRKPWSDEVTFKDSFGHINC